VLAFTNFPCVLIYVDEKKSHKLNIQEDNYLLVTET